MNGAALRNSGNVWSALSSIAGEGRSYAAPHHQTPGPQQMKHSWWQAGAAQMPSLPRPGGVT